MAMSADPIGQLLRREGHLPLTIEDRPRLDALLAAHPALLAGLRDALALAAKHFPAAAEIRLVVLGDPDLPEEGDHLTVEIWTVDPPAPTRSRHVALHPECATLPLVIGPRYRQVS